MHEVKNPFAGIKKLSNGKPFFLLQKPFFLKIKPFIFFTKSKSALFKAERRLFRTINNAKNKRLPLKSTDWTADFSRSIPKTLIDIS